MDPLNPPVWTPPGQETGLDSGRESGREPGQPLPEGPTGPEGPQSPDASASGQPATPAPGLFQPPGSADATARMGVPAPTSSASGPAWAPPPIPFGNGPANRGAGPASPGAGRASPGPAAPPYGGPPTSPYGSGPHPYATHPYGAAPYGQNPANPYPQPPYGQTSYGQTPYGGNPYSQNPYGGGPYGQNPYGQNPYGGSPYGPSPYGAGPYGPQGPPPGGFPTDTEGRGPGRKSLVAIAVVMSLIVAAIIGYGVASRVRGSNFATNPPSGNVNVGGSSVQSGSLSAKASAIATKVDPGIVDVNTVLNYGQGGEAAGTGMVLSSSGEVLTNNHVVEGSTSIQVTVVSTGKTYSATVVGTDISDDVAVIQLKNASGLKTVSLGDSSKVNVGDYIVALGNALGQGGTPAVAEGSVTALNQQIVASDAGGTSVTQENLTGLIQTSASLQPGDSGGPLVNANAEVIGMDTAASNSYRFVQQASGASYAVPINKAITIAKQMESGQSSGNVHVGPSAFLGVEVGDSNGIDGAQVSSVFPGSPAASTSLQSGDTITQVDSTTVDSPTALTNYLATKKVGDKVSVTWVDNSGANQQATVTLTAGPAK